MARLRKARPVKSDGALPPESDADTATPATGLGGLPLPSPSAATNLVIADIVLRAAGGLLRDRMEKGMLVKSYDAAKAERLVDGRSVVSNMALWGASSLARRSPLGLAVVVGGLAAKVLYDRGKRVEGERRSRKAKTRGTQAGKTKSDGSEPQA